MKKLKPVTLIIIAGFILLCVLIYNQKQKMFHSYNNAASGQVAANAIVFIGDSHIGYFNLKEHLGKEYVNAGIPGETTTDILPRAIKLAHDKPAAFIIEMGINDVAINIAQPSASIISSVLSNYTQTIDSIRSISPSSSIYINSLLPLTKDYLGANTVKANDCVLTINQQLQQLALQKQCFYIDVHASLIANNVLDPQYTYDGIHLNSKGYIIWAQLLKQNLREY